MSPPPSRRSRLRVDVKDEAMRNEAMEQADVPGWVVADDDAQRVVSGAGRPGGAGLGDGSLSACPYAVLGAQGCRF
jgi:hypothetical protein